MPLALNEDADNSSEIRKNPICSNDLLFYHFSFHYNIKVLCYCIFWMFAKRCFFFHMGNNYIFGHSWCMRLLRFIFWEFNCIWESHFLCFGWEITFYFLGENSWEFLDLFVGFLEEFSWEKVKTFGIERRLN